jgi:hypothetical protein
LINIASTGPISTTAIEAPNATAQLFPVMSSNQPITTGDTAPARAMPVKVQALEVAECSWDTSVPMTHSGESASSEQKNEKLRPQPQTEAYKRTAPQRRFFFARRLSLAYVRCTGASAATSPSSGPSSSLAVLFSEYCVRKRVSVLFSKL